MKRWLLLSGTVLALSSGCAPGTSSTSTTSSSGGGVCQVGQQQACSCPDGSEGTQSCRADGTGFGACRPCDLGSSSSSSASSSSATSSTATSTSSSTSSSSSSTSSSSSSSSGGQEACDNGLDDDGDGVADCLDSECTAQPDCNYPCPPATTLTRFRAELPVGDAGMTLLPDPGQIDVDTTVTATGLLREVAVRLMLTHPFNPDVDVILTTPFGSLDLATDNPGLGYPATIFVERAVDEIATARPPYVGAYRPEDSLLPLTGRSPTGAWRVTVADDSAGDQGILRDVTLYFCTCDGTAGCEFGLVCTDNQDNDGDSLLDCDDPDCGQHPFCLPESACSDRADNDNDGNTDCRDSDCDGVAGCEFGTELTCEDGMDNDADTATDCADTDCSTSAWCRAEANCGDGTDDDGDGHADCTDYGCNGASGCEFGVEQTCDDTLDNDADGVTDCADQDCDGVAGCEFGVERSCGDGVDNDGDGDVDCADGDCAVVLACDPAFACPAGDTPVVGITQVLPVAVPGLGVASAVATASGQELVSRVFVRMGATHSFSVANLSAELVSPNGVSVTLLLRNDAYLDTIADAAFSDAAQGPIYSGFPPFIGTWAPPRPLSRAHGQPADGNWELRVQNADTGAGEITQFELLLCTCTDCELGAACRDGVDNDNNAELDCADSVCRGDPRCLPETDCSDLDDNDLDGQADCADQECDQVGSCQYGQELSCSDSVDNDGDGDTDCADVDCATASGCEPGQELTCNDVFDNDGDGEFDCRDVDCDGVGFCEVPERTCDDLTDNDADGAVDCRDQDCDGVGTCEFVETTCGDGVDNDGDYAVDCLDEDCAQVGSCERPDERSCTDNLDNDGDGATDCADYGCALRAPCGPEVDCADNVDNDNDGQTDCGDTGCASTAACLVPCDAPNAGMSVSATDTPVFIPDVAQVASVINVTGAGEVVALGVEVFISHTYDSDMELTLLGPTGTEVILASRAGGSGDDFTATVFHDGAASGIAEGFPPFTGAYRPQEPLSAFNGTTVGGTWTLQVYDAAPPDTGYITTFGMYLCVTP
ncbi:MAG: proprotein convertase P-domain-containing protein [Myxococcota bacterium]